MDAGRYERLQELFHEAVEFEGAERAAFVAGADEDLRGDLEELLEEDARGVAALDSGVGKAAQAALGEVPERLRAEAFGPYRLERLLGEGGMGVVYLGRREDLGATAAIKLLRDAWLSPARRERFLAEQRTLAELRHGGIAALYDADTLADGTPWFAMELVEGDSITAYCRERGSDLQERLRLVRSACEAVQHAHGRAVIHRDIKPSNILVNGEGEVKLVDFGIAKHLTEVGGEGTLTAMRMMTPAYAAPEQTRGEATGVYTDVYGLGMVLFELLSGRAAERDRTARPSAFGHVRATRSEWADLDVLCLRAIAEDPARRYPTVEALLRDLDHFSNGEPLEARPDSFGYRAGKFLRRNGRAVSFVAAAALMVVGVTAFYTVRLAEARNEALAEAGRTQRMMQFLVNLFEGGDAYAGPAQDLRVATLVDRGADEARAMTGDPRAQAELLRILGRVEQKLGNLEKAEGLLGEALETERRVRGEGSREYAASLEEMALLRTAQARFAEGEKLAREALEVSRKISGKAHPAVARGLETLGTVMEEKGDYKAAAAVMREAVAARERGGGGELAESLFGLANVEFYAGDYAQAEALTKRVLTMHRSLYGPRHPAVAEDLVNLGAIQQEKGNYVEAERLHREALAITLPFYGEEHPKTAAGLTLVARALVFQKKSGEAEQLLERALRIRERVFGTAHPQTASTLNELGNLALARDEYDKALGYQQRVLGIYRRVYGGKHYYEAIGLSNLASTYMARKEFGRAEKLLREALTVYARTLPAGHVNEGIGRIKLGRVLLRMKRYREAEEQTRTGFEIVGRQANPAVSWLTNARKDLAEEYTALGETEKAKRFSAGSGQ